MSMITIKQAAKILGVSKKTLMRWHEIGRFIPKFREKTSKTRVYEESKVRDLKIVIDNEEKRRENIKKWHTTIEELKRHQKRFLLKGEESQLQDKQEECRRINEKLIKEFSKFTPRMIKLHKQFFMREK